MADLLASRWVLGDLVRHDRLGDVVQVVDADGRHALVRFLPPGLPDTPRIVAALGSLPRVAARHLAPLVDLGTTMRDGEQTVYGVWEVAPDSMDLESVLAAGPLPAPAAARVAADVCWGLTTAHAAGIVHGALCARDVIVVEGLRGSRIIGAGLYPIVRGALGRVPEWAAPEVRAGSAPTPASDLWSVGAMLRLALGELAESSDLPAPLAEVLHLLSQAEPGARPASARLVATRLVGLASGLRGPSTVAARLSARARQGAPSVPVVVPVVVSVPPAEPAPTPAPTPAPVDAPLPAIAPPQVTIESDHSVTQLLPPGSRRRRTVLWGIVATLSAMMLAAVALVSGGGSGMPARRSGAPVLTPAAIKPTTAPVASSAPSSDPSWIPPPIVAPEPSTDPAALARVDRITVTAGDVGPGATQLPIPSATDWNAFVRALYATCDYYSPVGSPRLAHRMVRYALPDGTEVFNDVVAYAVPAQSIIDGLHTSLQRCHDLQVTEGNKVVGRFRLQAPPTAIPGLAGSAIALDYLSIEPADRPLAVLAIARRTVLDVIIVRAQDESALRGPTVRLSRTAKSRLDLAG